MNHETLIDLDRKIEQAEWRMHCAADGLYRARNQRLAVDLFAVATQTVWVLRSYRDRLESTLETLERSRALVEPPAASRSATD